ncbi:histidine kinase [Paenibacillus sp. M1]|uniref:Histidine kinase n=1 Tax=Paenibacillus haidiansis TaxID=1574488 RepID=A0ABU7VQI2_9BACL
MTTYRRKTPEELLESIERLRRGKFKILVGAASGTGKTYHMLLEGQLLKARGIDVVICAVTTSRRPETVQQLEGLERIPSIHWQKDGRERKDLPLEELIKRDPEVLLVDNLAHRNRKGAKFATRLEDILFLLKHGISVITTINAYELAGADEFALRRAGIMVEETVPPHTLDLADEVRLIDVAPETVMKRIEDGSLGDAVHPSICRRDNLAVLRELSLRLVAEGVNDLLNRHREAEGLLGPSGATERILVAVQYHWNASVYIRRGQQIAKRLGGDLFVASFTRPGSKLTKEQESFKRSVVKLCRKIGAEFHEWPLTGRRSLPDKLAGLASRLGVTRIVMGHSKMSRMQQWRKGSVIDGLLRKLTHTDLFLMADSADAEGERIMPVRRRADEGEAGKTFRRSSAAEMTQQAERMRGGSFKVYIGAAPGVGKTYTMLREGNVLKGKGVDVVVGLIETHGRKETLEQLGGLEVVPRRNVEYKGVLLEEMDTEAILRRGPELVLVDELAHTNIPGSPHRKRYEDILRILQAGISVITTVNVQHLESLNDAVEQVTGVRVRETVPDELLRRADEVELIDVTPQMLQQRLSEGKIYASAKVEQALQSFFKIGNLIALRELALREIADDVDERLESWDRSNSLRGPWRRKELIFVCVDLGPSAERIIRHGFRLAYRLKAEWHVAFVGTSGGEAGERPDVQKLKKLTERLGGQFDLLYCKARREIADKLLARAEELGATQLIMGQPRKLRLRRLGYSRSVTPRLIYNSTLRDCLIVSRAQ